MLKPSKGLVDKPYIQMLIKVSRNPTEPHAPPSPPSTGDLVEKAFVDGWKDCEDPQLVLPAQLAPKTFNSRCPSRGIAPPQKFVWPKSRDMKPLPSEGNESNGGVSCKSDSNGDPNYDVAKLMAWNGDWMPPPVEWSARHRFSDRHFGASIEKWINTHDPSCTFEWHEDVFNSPDFRGIKVIGEHITIEGEVVDKVITKDLVPRTWVPVKIEGDAPQQFWRALPSRAPPALSDVDLNEQEPYWCAYPEDPKNCFLTPLEAPPAPMDPEDAENNHPKASVSAMEALAFFIQRKAKRTRKSEDRRSRPIPPGPIYQGPPKLYPTANIYLRPVCAADAAGIRVSTTL
jgi:hypothetical protein